MLCYYGVLYVHGTVSVRLASPRSCARIVSCIIQQRQGDIFSSLRTSRDSDERRMSDRASSFDTERDFAVRSFLEICGSSKRVALFRRVVLSSLFSDNLSLLLRPARLYRSVDIFSRVSKRNQRCRVRDSAIRHFQEKQNGNAFCGMLIVHSSGSSPDHES